MSELSDALRALADALDTNDPIKPPMLAPETCREAAARIEALEAEVESLEEALDSAGERLMGEDI